VLTTSFATVPDLAIAVVDAKAEYATPGDGLQQAKDYAEYWG